MRDAVIFDMDGLLLDSERIANRTFIDTCTYFHVTYDAQLYAKCIGTNLTHTAQFLNANIVDFPKTAFMAHWNEAYVENAVKKPVPVKRGVFDFLTSLAALNIPCAVATSSPMGNATAKLKNAGLIDYFSGIVFGDQVTASKPHPEIYLKAAEKVGIKPENCLALEDSDNGVRAAHAANMLVFQIPDLLPPSADILTLGHDILPSMDHAHQRFIDALPD